MWQRLTGRRFSFSDGLWCGGAALLVAAAASLLTLGGDDTAPPDHLAALSVAASPSASAAPTTVAPDPAALADQLRADFVTQAATDRGWGVYFGLPENVPALAQNVCGTLAQRPDSSGVWTAAANLEQAPFVFDPIAAWGFVGLSTTVYCPEQYDLVLVTTAAALS